MRRWCGLALVAGCAGSVPSVPAVRFANAPVATLVNDRRDVPQPAEREFLPILYAFDASVIHVVTRSLDLPRARRALGVNALDEVPDSTWFTNRIGTHELTPDEVRTGPVTHDPDAHRPWTIQSTKVGGTVPGFAVTDAAGAKYLLKFDLALAPPEMETATHVIVNRMMWACGYNVAEDQIIYIHREDLVIGADAKAKDAAGHALGPLHQDGVDAVLSQVRHERDGRIRVLVSRWIEGTTIGGHASEGRRDDDPNDRIPHELRRDLRGMLPIDTWLDAVDVTEGQFVDAWTADSENPRVHYVKHYAIDFGKSLGAMGAIDHDWWRSHAYRIDLAALIHGVAMFGFDGRDFEGRSGPTDLPAVSSLFDVASMDPANWHPDTPGYTAFRDADRFDQFWGTKLVARFTPAQIAAAVDAGKISDPRAAAYLTATLIGRQRALAAYWFARVAPLDRFEAAAGDGVCFDDLAIRAGLADAAATRYAIASFDFAGAPIGNAPVTAADASGRACTSALPRAAGHDGYTIYKIDIRRGAYAGTTYVHVARDPASGAARVIGVWRG